MPSALLAMYAVCGVTLFVEPQSHLPDATWPTHAFVTLPQGWVNKQDAMCLLEAGKPIAAQVEVAARWPDGSPKWVHAYASYKYAGGKPLHYEFEKRGQLPEGIPKSPLMVDDKPERITINSGAIQVVVARPFAGVAVLDAKGQPLVAAGGGPHLIDGRGIEWRAEYDDQATVTVEQQGPAQVTVKAEGWYQSKQRRVAPFCRFTTRITVSAGSPMVKFDHATIFAADMRRYSIAELGFKFPVAGATGFASGPITGALDEKRPATWFAQATADRMFTVDQQGAEEGRTPLVTGTHKRSAGWFTAELPAGRLALLTKDFWQKCPKEVKVGRDELTYYAWPRHGSLGKPDENSLRLDGIYKFQCFQVGRLLDSRLPSEYMSALEAQTDTDECKAVYARAANLQGVAMHNEFALTWLPADGPGPRDDKHLSSLQGLYAQSPLVRVSPNAVAISGVLGPVAPNGPEFAEQHRTVRDATLGFAKSIERYGDYGWSIYGNAHHEELMNPAVAGVPGGRPSLHRIWNNNHYQHVSTSWRLYAMSGDPQLLHWARICTDNYGSIGQVRYDSMSGYTDGKGQHQPGPDIKYHNPGGFYHCKGLVPWGGRDYGMDANDVDAALTGHWPDPSSLLLAWLFDANRWAKDGYELWLKNVKLPTGNSRREINTSLVHAITAYEYQPDPTTLAAIKGMIQGLMAQPLITQAPGPIWEPTWLSRYYEFAPDDEVFKKYLVASADAGGVNMEAIWTLALSATAYRITGDDKYLRRHAGTLERASRQVFIDPHPDKRWDRYGFGPGPGRDGHFIMQWHRFAAALKDAKITKLDPPDEPGQYLGSTCRYDNLPDVAARGTTILVLNDKPGQMALNVNGGPLSSENLSPTRLDVLPPSGDSLLLVERLPMSALKPVLKWNTRPSTWREAVETYQVEAAAPGLYKVILGSDSFSPFQPLTLLPECQLIRNSKISTWSEPTSMLVKLTRGFLVPLVGGRIQLRFTALGARDGSHVMIHDRAKKALAAQWIRAGETLTVNLGDPRNSPWLLDMTAGHSGYTRIEVLADAEEPLLYGSNLEHIAAVRKKLGK